MNCIPHAGRDGSCRHCGHFPAIAVTSSTTGCCDGARVDMLNETFQEIFRLQDRLSKLTPPPAAPVPPIPLGCVAVCENCGKRTDVPHGQTLPSECDCPLWKRFLKGMGLMKP